MNTIRTLLPQMDFEECPPLYILPKASEEQKDAIRKLTAGNVAISAVAGSGKTTTILYIAKVFPGKNILLLTYNAKLKFETREKAAGLALGNLEVHSYHSFCVRYIDGRCSTDAGIIQHADQAGFANEDITLPSYDLIIVDEAQDMTFLYYGIVKKVLAGGNPHICILGDPYQSIYGFNGADSRFMTFADRVFLPQMQWNQARLSTSYRITHQMAAFINRCVMQRDHMNAAKDGSKPHYLFTDPTYRQVVDEVRFHLRNYSVSDIFILAPSVRGGPKSPINRLSNLLSKFGIPVYMPNDDNRKLDEEVLEKKLVFSTYHQAKGLERKVVIVLGFDMSYYHYYNKMARTDECPNEIYVAITRAAEQLTLVHSARSDYLPFLLSDILPTYCDIIGDPDIPDAVNNKIPDIRVTDLIRHISPQVMLALMKYIQVDILQAASERINIPCKSAQLNPLGDVLFEEVSDITGTAIPAYYQYLTSNRRMDIHAQLPQHVRKPIKLPIRNPGHLLEIANRYNGMRSNLVFKVNQINDYNWLTQENLDRCIARMNLRIPKNSAAEVGYKMTISGRTVCGYIDIISNNIVWEIKCTSELTSEHVLQLAIYSLMYGLCSNHEALYYLYNVASDELWQITADVQDLIKIVKALIHFKYHGASSINDAEFLAKCGGEADDIQPAVCAECLKWRGIAPGCSKIETKKRK